MNTYNLIYKKLLRLGTKKENRNPSYALVIPAWWLKANGFNADKIQAGMTIEGNKITVQLYNLNNINTNNIRFE